jgi:hypothetical protein
LSQPRICKLIPYQPLAAEKYIAVLVKQDGSIVRFVQVLPLPEGPKVFELYQNN